MPALVAGIHVLSAETEGVDGRNKSGHDGYLELHAIAAFEAEHLPRLRRRRDLEAQVLDDSADFRYLFGVALGEFARADIERIFQTDADVAAHHRRGGAE